jgi:ferric-dicitrate binding protein FerR (iron transport regulator)
MKDNSTHIDYALLVRYFNGQTDENEAKIIQNWSEANEENQKRLQKLRCLWQLSEKARFIGEFDEEIALQKVKAKFQSKKQTISIKTYLPFLRIAAILIVGFGVFWSSKQKFFEKEEVKWISYSAVGKERIILPDFTVIFMNAGATVQYPEKFTEQNRTIKFEGEAYFEVKKNPQQPFVIETTNSITKVLGTAFNLRAIPDESIEIISVTEGKVQFSTKKAESIDLEKGEKGTFDKTKTQLKKETISEKNFLAWKTGKFEFDNVALSDALRELSLFYKVNLRIKNDSLNQLKLTAKYDSLSLNDLIDILKLTLNVEIEKQDQVYLLKVKRER